MEIEVLGTRGEIEPSSPYHSRHSGVLINKELLLDLGEEEFLKYKPKYILLTHLHPDHAFFINNSLKTKVPVYAPEKYEESEKIKVISKKLRLNSYKITPIPTHHSKKMESTAYLIEKNGKRILYTGDMIWINKKYHSLLKNLDLVITEASFMRRRGLVRKDQETGEIYGHTGVPNLINLFEKFTDRILFIHFGSWFYKDVKEAREKFKELEKKHQLELIVGYDSMELEV